MIELLQGGAFLVNGTDIVADTPEAAQIITSKTGKTVTKEEAAKPAADQKACYTGLPNGSDTYALAVELREAGVEVNREIVEDNSTVTMILTYVIMFGLLFGAMSMLTRRMGGDGIMGGIGSSKAKVYMEKQTGVTFKDVAGQDEAPLLQKFSCPFSSMVTCEMNQET